MLDLNQTRPPRSRRNLLWPRIVLLLVLWLTLSTQSFAQGASTGLDAIRQQMDKGQGLFLAGKYKEAAAAFEEGYRAHPYSAFLFNAGVCYQKVGEPEAALSAFNRYLEKDQNAPDVPAVKERISAIETALAEAKKTEPATGPSETAPPLVVPDKTSQGMKSLVVIETEPSAAPVKVYFRTTKDAPAFKDGAPNPLWKLVAEQPSPLNLTLDVGRYHIAIEKFGDFNPAATDLDVSEGHVHQFRANLSQGEFTGFLQVECNVKGAKLYLDEKENRDAIWGEAPHGALVTQGEHILYVEAPGFEPKEVSLTLDTSDKKVIQVELTRVGFGVLKLDADVGNITVAVDGRMIGLWNEGDSALEEELLAGPHEVLVRAKGYKDLRKTVTIPRGQILPVRARMVEKYPRGKAWTQAALAAGFVGAGIFLGVESNRLNKELTADREAGYLYSGDPRINQGTWYSIGATTGFTVGGLLAALSVYNFVRDPYPDPKLQLGKQRDFKEHRKMPEPAAAPATSQRAFGQTLTFAAAIPTAAAAQETAAIQDKPSPRDNLVRLSRPHTVVDQAMLTVGSAALSAERETGR